MILYRIKINYIRKFLISIRTNLSKNIILLSLDKKIRIIKEIQCSYGLFIFLNASINKILNKLKLLARIIIAMD